MTLAPGRVRVPLLVGGTVFLVAMCLRPSVTAVGPVLPRIGRDLGLGEGAQGLLGSLPLLAFAAVSPVVPRLSRRLGIEGAVLAALLVLAAGSVVRSYAGPVGLWVGTVLIGCAIAVGNVLVPVIVRRDFRNHISLATGVYTAFLSVMAGVASAVAIPLAEIVDWRFALAVWGLLALGVAAVRSGRAGPALVAAAPDPGGLGDVWRRPAAWMLMLFFGFQSAVFYSLITWLPTIEERAGNSGSTAGLHLLVFQLVGVVAGLSVPALLRGPGDRQLAATLSSSAAFLVGVTGLMVAPAWTPVWVVVAGAGSGSALVVALALVSLRGRDQHETTQLAGMTQSLGYLCAAAGPFVAGGLAELTGSWTAALAFLVLICLVQMVVAVVVARPARRDVVDVGTP